MKPGHRKGWTEGRTEGYGHRKMGAISEVGQEAPAGGLPSQGHCQLRNHQAEQFHFDSVIERMVIQ